MAETLAYNFVGNDELSRVFEALDRVANKLERTFDQMGDQASQAGRKLGIAGTEAKGASEEIDGLGDDAAKAGRKIDELGDDMDKAALKAAVFDAQIRQAKRSVRELTDEFVKTGDADILAKLGLKQGRLAELEKLKTEIGNVGKEVEKVVGDGHGGGLGIGTLLADLGRIVPVAVAAGGGLANIAKSVASGFGTGIKDVGAAALGGVVSAAKAAGGAVANALESGVQSAGKWASSNPGLAVGIAAGIGLGAPAIGGALAAAVGGGVIAGGILLAAQDPRVGQAWKTLGESAKDKLTGAANVFVDPLIRGADRFGATMAQIMPSIERDMSRLAPVADKLFSGAAGFVEKLMPGIDALSTQAGPTLTMLANELPRMGAAVSKMMEAIASGGEGGKAALHDLLVLTEALIVGTGNAVMVFEKWYQAERSLVQVLAGDFDGARKSWENLVYGIDDASHLAVAPTVTHTWKTVAAAIASVTPAAKLTGDQLKELEKEINSVALTADLLASKMTDKILNSMMSMDQAVLGFAESQTRLSQSIDENGRQLDIHKEKGQANREAILGAVQANIAQYDALIRAGAGAGEAAAAYDTNTKALEDQLRQAGFTQGAIDGLIGKYRGVPGKVNTDIATNGLTAAVNELGDLIRKLNGMPTRKDIYVTQHLSSVGSFYQSPDRLFDYPGAAYGGRVGKRAMGGYYDVGENGPERVVLPDDAYVIPNNQMTRGATGGGGGSDEIIGTLRVDVHGVDGAYIQSQLVRLARQRGHRTVAQLLPVGS